MLVLSRKVGEDVVLPGLGVTVRTVRIRGGRVTLAFDAPEEIKIMRGELTSEQIEHFYDDGLHGPGVD